MKKKKTT